MASRGEMLPEILEMARRQKGDVTARQKRL
jgi:hypothetical protein